MRGALVIDGRNVLDPEAVRAAGFAFEGIGRSRSEWPRGRREGLLTCRR